MENTYYGRWLESRRRTRAAMREAHEDGRHVCPEQSPELRREVVAYWAPVCGDCYAIHRYEYET